MSFSIAGKTAIVTGATAGVGLAIARHFAAEGASVVFAGEDEKALEEAVADLGGGEGSAVRAVAADLRSKLAVANLVTATIDAFDRIDILVNAARPVWPSDALDPEADGVQPMLDAGLFPALRLSQAVARRMIARETQGGGTGGEGTGGRPVPGRAGASGECAGAIVNLVSTAASRSRRGTIGHAVATAAVGQMTRSLAVELAPHRIRVNALAHASVETPALLARMREQPRLRAAVLAATPLARLAAPAELVHAAQFLASDAAGFVTGQILTADGGRSLLDAVQTAGTIDA